MFYGSIVNEEYAIPLDDDDDDDLLLNKSKNNDYKASTTMTYSTSSVERYCFQETADNTDYNDNVTTFKTGGNTTTTNWFFQLLGFSSNPLISTTSITGLKQQQLHYSGKNSAAADMRLAMLSNFSTAYNIMSISLALPMLQTTTARNDSDNNIKSLCSSALIAGMILGQLCGGTLGDVCGRHVAMALCMGLQIVGSLGSACCSMGQRLVLILSIWRFILGLGCGGVYPLAATLSSPSCPKSVALVFSMQGVGYLVVPAVAWGLIQLLPNQIAWRVLLGGGCLPGILLTLLRLQQHKPVNENLEYRYKTTPTTTNTRTASISLWEAIWMEENLWMKLLGTAGCWFLFDIMFYANTLFQPMVLSSAFGASETVQSTARDAFCIALMALPGYFISIATVGRQSPRYIQLQGFFLMGFLYATMSVYFQALGSNHMLLLILYGSTFFCSNYGPNCTTFMLPSMTFSTSCRSTLNGVCAACGKAGALVGTFVFCGSNGDTVLMWCSGLSLIGWCITYTCVMKNDNDDMMQLERLDHKSPIKAVVSRASIFDWNE